MGGLPLLPLGGLSGVLMEGDGLCLHEISQLVDARMGASDYTAN